MDEVTPFSTKAWESFYVIVGSSAGALTGLQFVVLTMIAEARKRRIGATGESIAAFGSPNVVHFCASLLVSAICSAPWGGLGPPGIAIAIFGALGVLYSLIVLRRTLRQQEYEPVPPSVQRSYAGVYEAADRPRLTVVFEDDKLFARAGDDAWFRIYPTSPSEFFAAGNATR